MTATKKQETKKQEGRFLQASVEPVDVSFTALLASLLIAPIAPMSEKGVARAGREYN